MKITPAIQDLKESFKRSGIWRYGFSFRDVMENSLMRQTLIMSTRTRLKRQTQAQSTTELQISLFSGQTS